jgi:hypothetical protein
MALILSEINQIEEFFYTVMQKEFPPEIVNFRERLRVITDTQQFKDSDEYIWKQKNNLIPKYYQIYFDDEFVCGFDSTFPPQGIRLLFLRNILQLVKHDKVILDGKFKKLKEEQEKEERKQKLFDDEVAISKIEDHTAREIVKSLRKKNAKHKTAQKSNQGRT